MTVALNDGEVVNSCDTTTGWSVGNISGDDDFVEGIGAIGEKISATTTEMYTTSLGGSAPYDFSVGGPEEGYHIIQWWNTKTPINSTTGIRTTVGNGTDRGHWYVFPSGFYKGGFITTVVDTARDFDNIAAGTWTTTGNPAQLTSITQMGGTFTTITSIMGNFNNCQLDQITIGTGLRVYDGTSGTPNNFESARSQDEDTSFWGWWSSAAGSIVGKGGLYIGPATGSVVSIFNSTAEKVVFANERVAAGFYKIEMTGSATEVDFDLISIAAADSSAARWSLSASVELKSFNDLNGVWSGGDQLVLHSASSLEGTTIIDSTAMVQNSASLNNITVLNSNTTDGVAFLEVNDPALITNSTFEFSAGHALELTSPGTSSLAGNIFTGFSGTLGSNLTPSSGSTGAAIYNNSGGGVTLNIPPGDDVPSIRNGAGAYTQVAVGVTHTTSGLVSGTIVRYIRSSDDAMLLNTGSSGLGIVDYSYSYESDVPVTILILSLDQEIEDRDIVLSNQDAELIIDQDFDRTYNNP